MVIEWGSTGVRRRRLNRGNRGTIAAAAFILALLYLACATSGAQASFEQPFACQIKAGVGGLSSAFAPGGLAVDGSGNLWASDPDARVLDEFDSTCNFVGPAPGPAPLELKGSVSATEGTDIATSLAIQRLSGSFFVTGQVTTAAFNSFVEVFDEGGSIQPWNNDKFDDSSISIDNSTESLKDPSACGTSPLSLGECYVYVAHAQPNPDPPAGDGLREGIEKFSSSGAPQNFVNTKGEPVHLPYVEGNEISGTPEGPFEENQPSAITVDSFGDIYAASRAEIDEYRPSGEFIQRFTGEHSPGLGGSAENGGFGGFPTGVAVDPVSGLLAVSLKSSFFEESSRDLGAVDEFDPASGKLLGQVTTTEIEPTPGTHEASHLFSADAVTFDPQGDLYVADRVQRTIEVYGPGRFVPSFRPRDVSGRTRTSAVLNSEVNPESSLDPEKPNPSLTSCVFEYTTQAAFDAEGFAKAMTTACLPAASEIAGDTWTPVHGDIASLTSGTTYFYRLAAAMPGTLGGNGFTEPLAFTAPHAPEITTTSSSNTSSGFVDLSAKIDPLGADTSYVFQYVDASNFEASGYAEAKATVETDIGSGGPTGSVDADVIQHVGGLLPGTTYHFRVLAHNGIEGKVETTTGSDATFTTLPATAHGLPDGRVYELVTPPNKGGATDMFAAPNRNSEFFNHDVGYASESGHAFLLETNSAFGPLPAAVSDRYVFRRSPGTAGWTYTSLASPSLGVQRLSSPLAEPAEFERVAFDDIVGSEASSGGSKIVSLVGAPGGPYTTTVLGTEPASILDSSLDTRPVGAANDMSTVVLESPNHTLAPGAKIQDLNSHALYEWNGTGQCGPEAANCRLLSVAPSGATFKCGARIGQGGSAGTAHDAVSTDGAKVFFTAPDPAMRSDGTSATSGCWNSATTNTPQIYMSVGGKSVEISVPLPGVKEAGSTPILHPAVFVGAAEDGSKVFFLSETELTEDVAKAGLHDVELYEYDTDTKQLTHITGGASGGIASHVITVPAISAQGTAVYFTAFGELVPGLPGLTSEESYLYRFDVATNTTSYVATVNQQDYPNNDVGAWISAAGYPSDVALTTAANWYTTPDGNYLLFSSSRELSSNYSTANSECVLPAKQDARNGHCYELYRYHYEPGAEGGTNVICVSCNPSGAPPVSDAEIARSAPQNPAAGAVRGISDDGAYVFFDSADPLVAQDGNGTLDAYEWHEGRISLISSGADAAPSFFLGISPDGANVFIGTHAQLTSEDGDTSGDVYDARICTTSDPCAAPHAAQTGQCEGDACQNPPPPPIDNTPVSLSFSGAGNFSQPVTASVKSKSLTKAQKLAKALKACRKKPKRKRGACERQAKKRYGSAKQPKKRAGARSVAKSGRARQ
jgi:hypothetical protein